MAQPFKGEQFRVLSANTGSQEWMAPEQDIANTVLLNCKIDLGNFQEITPEAQESFKKAVPNLAFVDGKLAGDILINSQAYNIERFKLINSDTVWLTKDGTYGKLLDAYGERGFTWGHYKDILTKNELLMLNVHLDNKGVYSA